jgi:chromatin assembly factor 1 subunit A
LQTVVDSDFFVLTPFPTKPDVTMATPPCPPLQDSTHFDSALSQQDSSVGRVYLDECKHKPRVGEIKEEENECDKNSKDVECMDVEVDVAEDDDVIITSPNVTCPRRGKNIRYKLLQFHTNHRPAYFGSWRKRSKMITPRNPFKKDEVYTNNDA